MQHVTATLVFPSTCITNNTCVNPCVTKNVPSAVTSLRNMLDEREKIDSKEHENCVAADVQHLIKVVRDTLHARRQIQTLSLQLRAALDTDEVLSLYLLQQHGLEI